MKEEDKMILTIACVVTAATCCYIQDAKSQQIEFHQNNNVDGAVQDIRDHSVLQRRKRVVAGVAYRLIMKGMQAWNELIYGATRVKSRYRNIRNYEKPGGYPAAEEQFLKLGPNELYWTAKPSGNSEWTGQVGDRTVTLKTSPDKAPGKTYIQMYRNNGGKGDRIIDEIRYMK